MKLNKLIHVCCFAVCASMSFAAMAQDQAQAQSLSLLPPGAGLPGPYPVGQTTLVVQDPNRPGGTTNVAWTGMPYGINPYIGIKHGVPYGRQWIVDIFYPADWRHIRPSTPKANFWNISASIWEKNGIHTGYDSVPVATDRQFPLVVFLNGLQDEDNENSSQGYHLASQGIITAMLRFHGGDYDFPDINDPDLNTAVSGVGEAMAVAFRGVDASQTLDAMHTKNWNTKDLFFQTIDENKIAVAGWSTGALCALAMTEGWNTFRGNVINLPKDPRVKAVVPEDAASWLVPYSQLTNLAVPAMFLCSSGADGIMNPKPFNADQAEEYKVKIVNAVHTVFACDDCNLAGVLADAGIPFDDSNFNQCAPGLVTPQVANPIIYGYTTAFLKKVLDHDYTYAAYFNPYLVYPSENGQFYFIDQKGGDLTYNTTTVLEDVNQGEASFIEGSLIAFYFDGNFPFWLTQPPLF